MDHFIRGEASRHSTPDTRKHVYTRGEDVFLVLQTTALPSETHRNFVALRYFPDQLKTVVPKNRVFGAKLYGCRFLAIEREWLN